MRPEAGRRPDRHRNIDTSGTPLSRMTAVPMVAGVSVLMAALPAWWLTRLGLPAREAVLGAGLFTLVSVAAQEPVQRAIGGGRLDNRLVPRLLLALGLFWGLTVTARLGFLFPVSAVLVAAVHVHWTGSQAWRPAARIAVIGTVLEEALLRAGLVRSFLPEEVSPAAAAAALGLAVLGVVNLGLAAARREEIAAELARTEQRFRTLVQHSSDLVLVLDREGTITYTTSAAESVVHHGAEQLVGRTVDQLVHPGDRAALLDQLARVLADPAPVHRELRAAEGEQWLELTARSLLDDPEVQGVLVNVRDVTERRAFQDRLAHAASHDDLTGLFSRAELEPRLADLVAAAAPGSGVAMLYVDLDGFKEVNDRLGHAAGDTVLVAVADRLTALLRPEDVLVRMGGDEFVAVLPGVPDVAAAEATVQRVRDLLVQPVPLAAGGQVGVGVSIGLVFLDRPDPDVERLVATADVAMYHEKRDKHAARASSR